MTSFPRTEREARARSERKLRAVEKKARDMLMELTPIPSKLRAEA